MKDYKNLAEINRDLKILQLKRNVALEELKYVKNTVADNFNPYKWLQVYVLKKVSKYGLNFLFQKQH